MKAAPVDPEKFMHAFLNAGEDRRRDALAVLEGRAVVPSHKRGPLLMGMGDAAAFLGVSRPTLWRMIQAGKVEKVELFPGSHRVRREDLEDLAAGRNRLLNGKAPAGSQ